MGSIGIQDRDRQNTKDQRLALDGYTQSSAGNILLTRQEKRDARLAVWVVAVALSIGLMGGCGVRKAFAETQTMWINNQPCTCSNDGGAINCWGSGC